MQCSRQILNRCLILVSTNAEVQGEETLDQIAINLMFIDV